VTEAQEGKLGRGYKLDRMVGRKQLGGCTIRRFHPKRKGRYDNAW